MFAYIRGLCRTNEALLNITHVPKYINLNQICSFIFTNNQPSLMPNCDHMLCLYNPKLLQRRRKKSNPKATSNNQIIINIENKLKKLESKLNYHFQFQTPLHFKRNACVEF